MYGLYDNPVRCLACATLYDNGPLGELPTPCPQRYLSPHTEEFMRLVAQSLDKAGAAEKPTRDQHEAAIREARASSVR